MKISKKRIIEIIKEEIERDLAGSESDLQVKLRDQSTAIRDEDVKIEPAEAEQVDAMITRILTVASMDNVSTADLKKANDSIQKYLNVDALTEEVLEEASPAAKRKIALRALLRKAVNKEPRDWENIADKFIQTFLRGTPKQINAYIEEIGDAPQEEEYINALKDELGKGDFKFKLSKTAEKEASHTPSEEVDLEALENATTDALLSNETQGEQGLEKVVSIYRAFVEKLDPQKYPQRQTGLHDATNGMIEYFKSQGKATQQNGNSVLMAVSNFGTENIRTNIMRALNNVLGLEQDATPWEQSDAEQPTPPNITPEILRDLVVKFSDMLKSNNLLSEGIGDIVKILDIKDTKKFGALLGKTFTRDEIKMIDGIFQSDLKDTFVDLVRKAATPEASEETPQPEELPSGEKAIVAALPELQDAFAKFSNDDSGFMKVGYLKDQDEMIGALRSALRKFIGLEGLESALTVQEEQNPEAPPPEDKTKGARQKLVKDVGRYRRDLNDTGNILGQYLKAAKAGQLKAQPILNKLKVELQKVQDNNVVIVRDLKSIAGLKESLLTEEETRDEKIANVRRAYDAIVGLLRPTLQIRTPEPEETTTTTPKQGSEEDNTVKEVVLEDIFLEQTGPTEGELQSLVDAVKQSLEQIDSIKKYFRVTGTFNRPLDELQTDFLEYVNSYKKTMSDLVADLRQGVPSPENATQYAQDFARLAEQIKEDFGVSPSEPIKVAGVPAVQPEGAPDETAAVNDSPKAAEVEQATVEPEVEPDETADSPEADGGPRPDDITDTNVLTKFLFDNQSDYFSPSKMSKIFGRGDIAAWKGIRRLLLVLFYSKILRNRQDTAINSEPLQEEETDRQRLTRFGTPFGYQTEIIRQFLIFIEDKNYRSKGKQGSESTPYNVLLNTITTLGDTKLKLIFSTLKKAEEDLKNADVAFNVESPKIKQKINTLLAYTRSANLAESKQNFLERLIKEELKVLNGKKMVCN